MLFTAHLAPLCTPTPTQFTRTIGGPAALCWSTPLMDARGAAREGGGGRGRDDRGRRASPGCRKTSTEDAWFLCCAFGAREQALQVLRRNSKISADAEGPNLRAGGTRARALPARMSREMPPRHQMSVECQRLHCLCCSPFIFWVVFFFPPLR